MSATAERLERVLAQMAAIVEPPPDRTADQWADQNRMLDDGPWRTDFVPYTREPYRAASDPRYSEIVVVKGAQQSFTEWLLNIIGHRLDDGPYVPMMYVGPTQKQVSGMSRDRFSKMINSSPSLYAKLQKGQDDKVAEKYFNGVRVGFAWAGSATELRSWPAGLVALDERDAMDDDVGGEGDPFILLKARGKTFAEFKILAVSTPTTEGGSAIVKLFEGGSMMKWAFPCQGCYKYFVPNAKLLKYPSGAPEAEIRNQARVACPNCGELHHNSQKREMNANGIYIPHRLDEKTGEHVAIDVPIETSRASFWVSGLASPFPGAHWGELAVELSRAYKSNDQDTLQGVLNTSFGETFRVRGDAPKWEVLTKLVKPIPAGCVPEWASLLTMGCDVQKDGVFWRVRAYGFDHETNAQRSHGIDEGFIYGDTEFDDVWLQWQTLLNQQYGKHRIGVTLIDSGYNPARDRYKRPEHKIYEVCRRSGWKAFPSKGHDQYSAPVVLSKLDRSPTGKAMPGLKLWHIDTDHFKSKIHGQIRTSEEMDEPVWSLNAETGDDFCKQVVAEELVVKSSGHRKWVCPGNRANHYLDCEVLCEAGAYIYRVKTLPGFETEENPQKTAQTRPQTFIKDRGRFIPQYQNFIKR